MPTDEPTSQFNTPAPDQNGTDGLDSEHRPTEIRQNINRTKVGVFALGILLVALSFGGYLWLDRTQTTQVKESIKAALPGNGKDAVQDNHSVSFLAVGDIMLSRTVAKSIYSNGQDPNWPFANIKELLSSTDFNFGNLESPYSGSDSFNPDDGVTFNSPPLTAPGLSNHNFKVLNLANNHILDQGVDAIAFTKSLFSKIGVATIGAGQNSSEAWSGTIQETNGIKIGFLGATYGTNVGGGDIKKYHVANIKEVVALTSAVSKLKEKSDFVVVTMHAGTEYTREITEAQQMFARAAIDAGADMVIGAHPHWVQSYEEYKGKYIFYSLGNFVFDQEWSRETKEALALKITLGKSGADGQEIELKRIEPIPLIIENYGQPRVATENEKTPILKALAGTKRYFWE